MKKLLLKYYDYKHEKSVFPQLLNCIFKLNTGLFLIFFILFSHTAFGQGCSDAGFCTMGAMRPNQNYTRKINVRLRSIELTQYYGYTKFQDHILSTILDVNIGIGEKTSFQVKLPYTQVYSKLNKNTGLGDISFSISRAVYSKDKYQINATIGGKIPTNSSTQTDDVGHAQPMYIQTSLGTYDVIAGISLISRKWLFAFGYQLPLNTNKNQFTKNTWANDQDLELAARYPNSTDLKRGSDIMIRAERNFRFSRFNGYLGLLPIYRINKDIATNDKGIRGKIEGSNGLVINLLTGAGYRFSVKSGIKLLCGFKLRERKTNPDGLSREFVSTLGYEYRF